MAEKILTKKERREQIKADLAAAKKSAANKDMWIKILIGAIVVIAIGVFIWLFVSAKNSNKTATKDLGQVTCSGDQCVRTHINPGEKHAAYNSNPPSNGPHYSTPLACKIYDSEITDEQAVHSLEHGAVWITYKDKNDSSLKSELSQVVNDEGGSKLILSPRAADDSVIGIASWGRVLKLDSFDKTKIEDYIKLYRDGPATPEPLAGC